MADTRITDPEIAGYMGWRGPGAYTEVSLRKIREIIDHVLRAERATPPSPSTAPEAWVYECRQPGDDKDKWVEFFSREKPSDEPYLRNIRPLYSAALASRPAEVDDEGLPPLPSPTVRSPTMPNIAMYFTAEQYRQGQRDAVAADRARREKGGA